MKTGYKNQLVEEPKYLISGFREYTNSLVLKLETPKNRKMLNDLVDDLTNRIQETLRGND